MKSNYVVGMDCGATHTKVVVWKKEEIVFEANDWPGLNMDLMTGGSGFDNFQKKIESLKLYKDANWLVAMAGLDSDKETEESLNWWKKNLTALGIDFNKINVISDIELVLWSGSSDGNGIALIAGTGSNCLGRDSSGKTIKVGGMSHLMSDEGSGFMLGYRCLHLVTKMNDGRLPKTKLLKDVLDLYEKRNVVDLKNLLVTSKELKYDVARCAITLLNAAESGDTEAIEVVDQEAMELFEMINTANRGMSTNKNLHLYLAGSLFTNEYYLNKIKDYMKLHYPNQKIVNVKPIFGVLNYLKYFDL